MDVTRVDGSYFVDFTETLQISVILRYLGPRRSTGSGVKSIYQRFLLRYSYEMLDVSLAVQALATTYCFSLVKEQGALDTNGNLATADPGDYGFVSPAAATERCFVGVINTGRFK